MYRFFLSWVLRPAGRTLICEEIPNPIIVNHNSLERVCEIRQQVCLDADYLCVCNPGQANSRRYVESLYSPLIRRQRP